jgi:Putative transposase DNA-binding domain
VDSGQRFRRCTTRSDQFDCRVHFAAKATASTIPDSIDLWVRLARLRHRYRNLPTMAAASSTPVGVAALGLSTMRIEIRVTAIVPRSHQRQRCSKPIRASRWGKLSLSVRELLCLNCGAHHDRDSNAAKNIEQVGVGHIHDSKRTRRKCKTSLEAVSGELSTQLEDLQLSLFAC